MNMKKMIRIVILIMGLFVIEVKAYNKSVVNITDLTLSEEIELLDKGVITSYELVSLYLDRINTYNSDFNVLITLSENILEEAKYSDDLRKEGKSRGVLEGIPIIVKDNIDVRGMPTTAGARALADNYPNEDADVVKKLKDNGAIIIGKANMSEFAFSAKDSYSSYGYVNNAYRIGYTSYGSSGGSAVGVALNFASVALGTDTNSSVRLPAAAAGLVGIRPTTGKVSSNGVINYDINRDTVGVLSKSVADNKIVFDIISDNSERIDSLDTIRIGIPISFYEGSNDSSLGVNKEIFMPIKEMLDREIERLKDNSIEIVFLDDFYNNDIAYYNTVSLAGYTMCRAFNSYILNTTGSIRNFKQLSKSSGKTTDLSGYYKVCNYSNSYYNKSLKYIRLMKEYVNSVFVDNDLDFILYPSTKNEIYAKANSDSLINVSSTISSTSGYPSIVLPLGYYDNMPYGVELLAKEGEETKLYYIADIIEKHNNLINSEETAAKDLYEVPGKVKELVDFYLENYGSNINLDAVREYFRNYNNMEEPIKAAKTLLDSYHEKEVEIKKVKVDSVSEINEGLFMFCFSLMIFMFLPRITLRIDYNKKKGKKKKNVNAKKKANNKKQGNNKKNKRLKR